MFDAAVVYSYFMDSDGSLGLVSKTRMDLGISAYFSGKVGYLILPGGLAQPELGRTHAEALEEYAISEGVNPDRIITEDLSLDTTMQVFRVKRIMLEREMNGVLMVSSKRHLPRIRYMSEFMMPNATLGYVGINIPQMDESKRKSELNSLRMFYDTFASITPGDDEAIAQRMIDQHALYHNLTLDEILRVSTLPLHI